MNPTHIHLLLNHFPIIGTLIGSAILLYSIIKKQDAGKVTGAFIIVIMAIIAIPVLLTGEPAEESVEHLSGISKALIHDHEEASEKAFWLMEITVLRRDLEFISSFRRGFENKELRVFIVCKFQLFFLERIGKVRNKTTAGLRYFYNIKMICVWCIQ